jgi:hypothetical protein
MRSEALKPPVAFSSREMKGVDHRQGYPDPMGGMASFQTGAGYPYGMDFSSYGMPMGMYGYGGYAMGGQGGGDARLNGQMPDGSAQYGGGMYGMMGGAFQGGMMGYG